MKRDTIRSMKTMLEEFKTFILKGNVVQLAVAVVIGAAFGQVVKAVQDDIISPILGAFGDKPSFKDVYLWKIAIGAFIDSIISFVITAAAVFFVIVKPMNRLMEMFEKPKAPGEEAKPPASLDDVVTAIKDLQQQLAQMQGAQPKTPPPLPAA